MTSTATRLIFRSDLRVEVESYEVPEPGPRQVLVRVARSQVSAGSEMNFVRRRKPDDPAVRRPLGYMTVGRVERVGSAVTEYAVGDRVFASGNHGSHWLANVTEDGADEPDGNFIQPLTEAVADDQAGFAVLGDVALH